VLAGQDCVLTSEAPEQIETDHVASFGSDCQLGNIFIVIVADVLCFMRSSG
jgi:hypothetical protein